MSLVKDFYGLCWAQIVNTGYGDHVGLYTLSIKSMPVIVHSHLDMEFDEFKEVTTHGIRESDWVDATVYPEQPVIGYRTFEACMIALDMLCLYLYRRDCPESDGTIQKSKRSYR
jgi:hypothetical protein